MPRYRPATDAPVKPARFFLLNWTQQCIERVKVVIGYQLLVIGVDALSIGKMERMTHVSSVFH
jgi:hypothetical protein